MKNKITIVLITIVSGLACWLTGKWIVQYRAEASNRAILKAHNQALEDVIDSRREKNYDDQKIDPFGEDKIVRVLLIGLDNRIGQENGHCDAIQMIAIDNATETITVTAVPRGTYSPLPLGKGATPTDYYVSNACGLGGLEYGIAQIEKILGLKADYLVIVGFSETMGILRHLKLPTTETLQWLRNRHGYTIGEPQRAHNHSTFIKQLMLKFIPLKQSKLDIALQYIMYGLVKTDLSLAETQKIIKAIAAMDIANHPERIQLSMRPAYQIQEIAYDQASVNEYLAVTLCPIEHLLNKDDYAGISAEELQIKLLAIIETNKDKPEFIRWAYENNLWLQIEDHDQRLTAQYNLLLKYLALLDDKKEYEAVLTDYILEMENRGEPAWREKAKNLLAQEFGYN